MGKRGLIALALGAFLLPLHALEAVLLPSLAVNVRDQQALVPSSRPLLLPTVSEISAGQRVNLFLLVKDPQSVERNVTGTLKVTAPGGSVKTIAENASFLKGKTPGKGSICSGVTVTLALEPSDPEGEYCFELSLLDQKTNEHCRTECRLKLLPEDVTYPPMEDAEWQSFLLNYYRHPNPRRLLAALDYFFDHEAEIKAKLGKNHDLRWIFYGFGRAFSLNPHLWPSFALRWVELDSKEKKSAYSLILSAMGDEAVQIISGKIGGQDGENLRTIHTKKLISPAPVRELWQMYCLLMDFCITGQSRPVELLCGELRQRKCMTLEQYNAMRKEARITPEDRQMFLNFLLTEKALDLLSMQICSGHFLVAGYMEGMLLTGRVPDATAGARMEEILRHVSRSQTKKNPPAGSAGGQR